MKKTKNLYPIPITWEKLYREIFCKFAEDQLDSSRAKFLEQFINQTEYARVFPSADKKISEFFCGSKDAKSVFYAFRDQIIQISLSDDRKKTCAACPKIKEFKTQWESLIPFCKELSPKKRTQSFDQKRNELGTAIAGILRGIPEKDDHHRIGPSLLSLMDEGKYALVLGIMSAIASTLSCFADTESRTSRELPKNLKLIDIVLPAQARPDGDLSDTRLASNPIQITWKQLHNDIYLSNAKGSVNSDFNPFLQDVFPNDLFSRMFDTDSKGKLKANVLKYTGFVYKAANGAKSRFERARNYIIGMRTDSGEGYTWNTSPVIQQFQKNWERLLPESAYSAAQLDEIPEDMRASVKKLQNDIHSKLHYISQDPLNVSARVASICKEEPYSKVLAILSVIASTLFCFGTGEGSFSDKDRHLHSVVLPLITERKDSPALKAARERLSDKNQSLADYRAPLESALKVPAEMGEANYLLYLKACQQQDLIAAAGYLREAVNAGYLPAVQKDSEAKSNQLLIEARSRFHKVEPLLNGIEKISTEKKRLLERMAGECCEKCEQILKIPSYVPDTYKGEASYILYKCINSKAYAPKTGETARYYLKISSRCGYEDAVDEWKKVDDSTITPKVERSSAESAGVCYTNADNPISATFEKTIPDSWGESFQPFDLKTESERMLSGIACRFLLVDDNYQKNAEDFFQLLQLVKADFKKQASLNWEIFLRHDSDTMRALVDTALSRLPEVSIPVYILNDDKIAAQQLLSRHPLFFPVRSIKVGEKSATKGRKPLLHFVVFGTSDTAHWLVREAFWMMGFRNNAIDTQITILAENAKSFENQLKSRYPGMAQGQINIQGVALPAIYGKDVDIFSWNFTKEISEITAQTPYCYFAVATDSDDANLSLATRIRETLIRGAITNKRKDTLLQQTPIAFLCRDNQTACLSRSLVIEKEDYGDSWYNTWALIPFGEYSARYTFDEIAGGTFDALAKSIHYQYSQVSPSNAINCTSKAQDAAREYYRRQYNQDSSYSMALGMPYRLFQFQDAYGQQICPTAWSILEYTVYSSVTHLKNLASQLKTNLSNEEIKEIAEWEHGRWIRWMLSRGWLPLSFEEAVFAYKRGNPRQQLFVSKQHPCICAYEDLKELQTILQKSCRIEKDFYTYDSSNIRDTKKLLSLEWIPGRGNEIER